MKKIFFASLLFIFFMRINIFAIDVPWEFEIFREADFGSQAMGKIKPHALEIVEHGENDWVKIATPGGVGWVNLLYTPAIKNLDEFFLPLGNNIAVFYRNLDTGYTYVHNPDRVFFAASLSKSNHALYTYALAERGEIDMYEVRTYTSRDEWGGTGIMRFLPFGTTYTVRELLGFSIQESDNAAFRMLERLTNGAKFSYRDFVSEIGADSRMIRDVLAQNTHARDAGLFMQKIYDYVESESLFGHYLKFDMLNTAQTSHPYFTRWEGSNGVGGEINIRMIRADYPLARKYGWARNAFHDAGIIYAPSPYILVVLSNMERGAHNIFEEVSLFVQNFNSRTFVSPIRLNAPVNGPKIFDEKNFDFSFKIFRK
ncbi:MAG: serine hydrolase [Defluviitaleaceae bacterium]|nr:serine hydrolase [Defluviitaleaceae bacterium]